MPPAYFYKIASKAIELGKSEYEYFTSERSIRDLYKGFKKEKDKAFMDSIFVRNHKLEGITMRFSYKGILFTFLSLDHIDPTE